MTRPYPAGDQVYPEPQPPSPEAFLRFVEAVRSLIGWAQPHPTYIPTTTLCAIVGVRNWKWLARRINSCKEGSYPPIFNDSDLLFPVRCIHALYQLNLPHTPQTHDLLTALEESFDEAYPNHPVRSCITSGLLLGRRATASSSAA